MRKITYAVGVDSIKPSTVQFAGFAGENYATKLVFDIDDELRDKIPSEQGVSIMLECIDNSGEYDAFVFAQDVVDAPESVTFDIPKKITELGGRATMQLSFVELDADSKLNRKLFAYPIKLRFAPSTSGGIENTVEYERYHTDVLSAMVRAEQAEAKAEEQAQLSSGAASAAEDSAQSAQQRADDASKYADAAKDANESAKEAAESAITTKDEMALMVETETAKYKKTMDEIARCAEETKKRAEAAKDDAHSYMSEAYACAGSAEESATDAVKAALRAESAATRAEAAADLGKEGLIKKELKEPVDILPNVAKKDNTMVRLDSSDGKPYYATNNNYYMTDLIYVSKGESLVFTGAVRIFIVYNEDKESIPELYVETNQTNFTFTASDNQYVQLTVYKHNNPLTVVSSNSGYQIEKGVSLNADNIEQVRNELSLGYEYKNMLTGKKWVACGDSFTHGGSGLTELFESGLYIGEKKTYPFYIGRRCGMVVVNEAQSGSTLAYCPNRTENGQPRVDHFSNTRYQSKEFDDADYITIKFGINDGHQNVPIGTIDDTTNETFYGAWNVVLQHLVTTNPTAHIGIIVTNGATEDYVNATIAAAEKWGVPYLNMANDKQVPLVIRNNKQGVSSIARDAKNLAFRISEKDTHPNAIAHEYESRFIESWLMTI